MRTQEVAETMLNLDKIDKEIQEDKKKKAEELDELLEVKHMGFINEMDFGDDSEKYQEFLDAYIHCYYEPLIPEYDEAKFSINYFEDKFGAKAGWMGINRKKINGIYLKNVKY